MNFEFELANVTKPITSMSVDFILVFENDMTGPKVLSPLRHERGRQSTLVAKFLKTLNERGLSYENEESEVFERTIKTYKKVHYVKIRASEEFLAKKAELLQLKMPFKEVKKSEAQNTALDSSIFRRKLKSDSEASSQEFYKIRFLRQLMSSYPVQNNGSVFTETQRIQLIWSQLESISIQDNDKTRTLHSLLQSGVFSAAYPLHDGDIINNRTGRMGRRATLEKQWSRFKRMFHVQPLDDINDYFGNQTALYFAWLEFYTKMLMIPALLGLLATIFGVSYALSDEHFDDYCDKTRAGDYIMCPTCNWIVEGTCGITKMFYHCQYIRLSGVFDNTFAVAYGLIVCLWSMVFVEVWKRRQAQYSDKWSTQVAKSTQIRSQFIKNYYMHCDNLKPTEGEEQLTHPIIGLWNLIAVEIPNHRLRMMVSGVLVVCFVVLATVTAVGSGVFRTYLFGTFRAMRSGSNETTDDKSIRILNIVSPSIAATLSVSVVNGFIMMALSHIYTNIAHKMTNYECPKTEQEFEKSFIYKIFAFQVVNYFIGVFYTAFAKQWIGNKHLIDEKCPTNGCLADVCIQLLVVMTLKQCFGNVMEIFVPFMKTKINNYDSRFVDRGPSVKDEHDQIPFTQKPQWERDYHLMKPDNPLLYLEYLEMCIQYAFVILFAAAFPPGAILALLNNMVEVRIDARKVIHHYRRPVPLAAQDIGPWFAIIQFITRAAVITNAAVIAFAGNFIDRFVFFVYQWNNYDITVISTNSTLYSNSTKLDSRSMRYINHIYNNISTFGIGKWFGAPDKACEQLVELAGDYCYVRNYVNLVYNPDDNDWQLEKTKVWWHVIAAKLVFVVVFEKMVYCLHSLICGLIPDVPDDVTIKRNREVFLEQQAFMQANPMSDS